METAYIETTVRRNTLGRIEVESHRWVGKSPYVRISYDLLCQIAPANERHKIQLGPYRLLLVDQESYWDAPLYVRADKFGALRVALYKYTRLLDLAYRRLIITLAVWNLADYHEGTMPAWKDIKALKRFAK